MHGVGFVLESRAQGGALRDCEAEQGAVAHAQLRRFDALLQRVCSRARQALEETTTRRGGRVAELGAHFSQGVAQLEVFGAQAVEQRVQRVVLLDVLIDVFFLFRAGRSGFRTARAASSQLCASQRVLDGRERALWRWRRRWREGRKRREAPRGRDALVCQGSDVEAERALLVGLGQARVDACLRGGDGGLCRQGRRAWSTRMVGGGGGRWGEPTTHCSNRSYQGGGDAGGGGGGGGDARLYCTRRGGGLGGGGGRGGVRL